MKEVDTIKRGLIIMAHGSRRAEANDEFFTLVEAVAQAIGHSSQPRYSVVKPALLEQAPPSLLLACQGLPADITEIDVYPLFFNQGRHVGKDLPALVAEVMEALPDKSVVLLDYFGKAEGLAGLVVSHIDEQHQSTAASDKNSTGQ